jgi:hypothetical protein
VHKLRAAVAGAWLAALISLTLGGSVAGAAKPVKLNRATTPHVAVDSSGRAYIVSSEQTSPSDALHYCRLSPGANGCSASKVITDPSRTIDGGGYAFPLGGGRVLLLDSRCCVHYNDKFLYTSTDGGKTFGTAVQIGSNDLNGSGIAGGALYVPAGAFAPTYEPELILTINGPQTIGSTFQATGTTGPASAAGFGISDGEAGGALTFSGSIARSGHVVMAAYTDEGETVRLRYWSGGSDINTTGGWLGQSEPRHASIYSDAQLAGGPHGIYLAYNKGGSGHEHWVLERVSGSFLGPTKLSPTTTGFGALAADSKGRIHFIWRDGQGRLRYRHTKKLGTLGLSKPETLLGSGNRSFANLDLAVNGGRGWATWNDGSPSHVFAFPFKAG